MSNYDPKYLIHNSLEHINQYLNNTDWCLDPYLQILDPPGPLTGLWSVPRSGNYWMRHLSLGVGKDQNVRVLGELEHVVFPKVWILRRIIMNSPLGEIFPH